MKIIKTKLKYTGCQKRLDRLSSDFSLTARNDELGELALALRLNDDYARPYEGLSPLTALMTGKMPAIRKIIIVLHFRHLTYICAIFFKICCLWFSCFQLVHLIN